VLKRQQVLAHWTPRQIQQIRDLVSFQARVDTIKALMPLPHVESVARQFYLSSADSVPPRGAKAPVSTLILKTYAPRTSKLALNFMYNQFDDLQKAGFTFADSVLYVYKSYMQDHHHLAANSPTPFVKFEHFYSIASHLVTKNAVLQRCSTCGSRNFFLRNPSRYVSSCISCESIAAVSRAAPVVRTA